MARLSLQGRVHGAPAHPAPPPPPRRASPVPRSPAAGGFSRCSMPAGKPAPSWIPRPRQDRPMQQYLLLIYIEPALLQALPIEEFNALMRDCLAHADKLQAEGTLLAAQKLQPVDTAQTLRVRDGNSRVLDGPFAETRELLAGFNLIVARDRDEAMRIARDFPWARFGSIEVRPLEDMDAERERCGAPAAAMAAAVP